MKLTYVKIKTETCTVCKIMNIESDKLEKMKQLSRLTLIKHQQKPVQMLIFCQNKIHKMQKTSP